MNARTCTPVKYHSHSFRQYKYLQIYLSSIYTNRKCTLSVSQITNYVMQSVFISSKCPNLSGISRDEPPHYTIKLLMFNTTDRGI